MANTWLGGVLTDLTVWKRWLLLENTGGGERGSAVCVQSKLPTDGSINQPCQSVS